MTDPQAEIAALRARVAELEADKNRILDRCVGLLGSRCKQNPLCGARLSFDEFVSAGAGSCGVCLTRRVAELEAELADTLEDAVRQGAYRDKDGTYHSNANSTWVYMMDRLVELGRFEITRDTGTKIIEGRFLPRKESNGPTQ